MTAHDPNPPSIYDTVVQGEYRVSAAPQVVLTTVLGSCVSVCLHDPVAGLGGMNHFLLPGRDRGNTAQIRFGAHAMELLINAMLRAGAQRGRLQAKVFGGSAMSRNLTDIGAANAIFAREFLADEDIPVISESLGGTSARRINFWPATGRARQLMVPNDGALNLPPAAVAPPAPSPVKPSVDVTLF